MSGTPPPLYKPELIEPKKRLTLLQRCYKEPWVPIGSPRPARPHPPSQRPADHNPRPADTDRSSPLCVRRVPQHRGRAVRRLRRLHQRQQGARAEHDAGPRHVPGADRPWYGHRHLMGCDKLTTDARGVDRPAGRFCDRPHFLFVVSNRRGVEAAEARTHTGYVSHVANACSYSKHAIHKSHTHDRAGANGEGALNCRTAHAARARARLSPKDSRTPIPCSGSQLQSTAPPSGCANKGLPASASGGRRVSRRLPQWASQLRRAPPLHADSAWRASPLNPPPGSAVGRLPDVSTSSLLDGRPTRYIHGPCVSACAAAAAG